MGTYPPQYAYPSNPPLYRTMPDPPRLHWGWVLGLDIVTRNLFNCVWLLVQANWVRKVNGRSRAFVWAIVHLCFFPLFFLMAFVAGLISAITEQPVEGIIYPVIGFGMVSILVLYVGTVFTLRSELESTPIEIPLGGVMTFFFGPIYFQYHLRDYGRAGTYSSGSLGLSSQPAPAYFAGIPVDGQYLPESLHTTSGPSEEPKLG